MKKKILNLKIPTGFCKTYLLLLVLFLGLTIDLNATHFRAGSVSWSLGTNDTIIFQLKQSWRRTFYPGPPNVGSVVNVGSFNFGNGTSATVNLTVTTVNTAEDWFEGIATLKRKYAANGTYTAFFANCCRISTLLGGANDKNARTETKVTVGNNNSAPISAVPPIVNMQTNQSPATFTLPGFDPDGDTFTFALATSAEMGGGFSQPAGLSLTSAGVLSFPTTGKAVGQLYATQVKITDSKGATSVSDFIIRIVAQSTPPAFDYSVTPSSGFVYSVNPGTPINFNVKATDVDPSDSVTLIATGLPAGATLAPTLPLFGKTVTTSFSWTPSIANLGSRVVVFTATDKNGVQTSTNVVIDVNTNPVFRVPPTPADGAVICLFTDSSYTFNHKHSLSKDYV